MNHNTDIPQELFEAIERYLNGTMDAPELKDFNDYLKIDPEFATQVKDIKTILLGIEVQAFKEQLEVFHDTIPKPQKEGLIKIRRISYSKLAAAVAVIIAISSIWFFSSSPNKRLYTTYFKPDPGLPTTSKSSMNNFDFYDAMIYYKHGDYKTAIKKWSILSDNKPNNDSINYFLGVAHLAYKKESEAIPYLERAVADSTFSLLKDAHYYLGLAYLSVDNVVLAKKHFNLSHSETSKMLLDQLE
ncbi:tol-pal system YbgF family protein [Mariniflexile ostreae]|uniref:Tol-pal system YbgF family protein n=1 Tax=Mariniflexile ostreae TaxID=1520892 RepID=A0ABV5FBM1_9FLAO